jgi:hypothetical protein
MDLRQGTIFFIFAFPLINNLPYFFGIFEPFPHAPTALGLFLFFFLGVLLNCDPAKNEDVLASYLINPLLVFALIVAASAAITFFRYTNYFPLRGLTIYEIKTNTLGVSAGGAIMSIVFQTLNYLTGLAFFWILTKTLRSEKSADEALTALGFSSLLSLGFAFFQHFGHALLGNNWASYTNQLINGTFKDALSFGAYLSMAAPLFLGLFFSTPHMWRKIVAASVVLLSFFLILYSGSKIGVFSLLAATACLVIWRIIAAIQSNKRLNGKIHRKNAFGITLLFLVGLAVGVVIFKGPILASVNSLKIIERLKDTRNMFDWRIRAQWDPAVKMIADYPLTGVGIGGFIIEAANYTDFYRKSKSVSESAENYLLQVGTELGITGLIAVLWVSWALYREIRRGFHDKTKAVVSARMFLAIGAACGILAFVLNSQMHSYIGSYEIKYMLWFLIGMLFCLSQLQGERRSDKSTECLPLDKAASVARGRSFSRRLPAAVAIMIISFGGIHLWNSTHSLSLQSRSEKLGLVQDFGFYQIEKMPDGREFRWTREYGAIPVKIDKPVLSVPIHASHPDIAKKPIMVQFYLVKGLFKSKRLLKEIAIGDNEWRNVDLFVADEKDEAVILFLKIDRTWNPLRVSGAPDPRNLGVAVGKVMGKDR